MRSLSQFTALLVSFFIFWLGALVLLAPPASESGDVALTFMLALIVGTFAGLLAAFLLMRQSPYVPLHIVLLALVPMAGMVALMASHAHRGGPLEQVLAYPLLQKVYGLDLLTSAFLFALYATTLAPKPALAQAAA